MNYCMDSLYSDFFFFTIFYYSSFSLFCRTYSSIFRDEGCILAISSDHLCITSGLLIEFSEYLDLGYFCERFAIFSYDEVGTVSDPEEVVCRSIRCEIVIRERDDREVSLLRISLLDI